MGKPEQDFSADDAQFESVIVDQPVKELLEARRPEFEGLYDALKLYRGRELQLFQLKGKESLRPKLESIEDVLEAGGAIETADKLLTAIVDEAESAETAYEFVEKLFTPSGLATGSDLEKFYHAYRQGLQVQSAEKEAA